MEEIDSHWNSQKALKAPEAQKASKGPEGLAPSAAASSIDAIDLDDLADVQLWDSNSMCQAVPSLQQLSNSFNS